MDQRPETRQAKVIIANTFGNYLSGLRIETLAKFGTVLNFQEHTIHIDHVVVAMRPYESLASKQNMRVKTFQTEDIHVPPSTGIFARDHVEPISTRDATKCTIETVDTDYKKANLPEIVKDTCKQISSMEQSEFLRLSTKYEELFGGTLGDLDTGPVKFDL